MGSMVKKMSKKQLLGIITVIVVVGIFIIILLESEWGFWLASKSDSRNSFSFDNGCNSRIADRNHL